MSLQPFFSVSPANPNDNTYDPANPSAPYSSAHLSTFGGTTRYYPPFTVADYHNDDQIHISDDPVLEAEQTITDVVNDLNRRSSVRVSFYGFNVSTLNQYLLVFRLAKVFGEPIAQFFVGTSFVRDEALTQWPYDDIAILLDTPGDEVQVYMNVRLAAANTSHFNSFFFKGVDCYLL